MAYWRTQGHPDRKAQYNIPAGGGKPALSFTGKDVRKERFDVHVDNMSKKAANKQARKDRKEGAKAQIAAAGPNAAAKEAELKAAAQANPCPVK
ncbi:hypothetical protein C8J56DRAFT_1037513 [Mycena floridula]|nr:hypothetical protein C8J56DRAFT_1037513 [Mycena floridula]